MSYKNVIHDLAFIITVKYKTFMMQTLLVCRNKEFTASFPEQYC